MCFKPSALAKFVVKSQLDLVQFPRFHCHIYLFTENIARRLK